MKVEPGPSREVNPDPAEAGAADAPGHVRVEAAELENPRLLLQSDPDSFVLRRRRRHVPPPH
jgi:hypothetical protein